MSDIEEAPSRRETLEAAFEAVNEPAETPTPTPPPVEAPPTPTEAPAEAPAEAPTPVAAKAERARDPKGRFAARLAEIAAEKAAASRGKAPPPPDPPAKAPTAPKKPPTVPNGLAPTPTEAPKPEGTPAANRAPQSWKPASREKWAALPPEVQAEVVRTERDAKTALEQSAQARRGWEGFQRAVEPYRAMIQADGADPVQATASLFQTAAVLRTGSAQQKAALVANIARTYGVDIRMLDEALVGEAGSPQQQRQAPEYRDPRVDHLFSRLQQAEQQQAQSLQTRTATEMETFAGGAEFFEDVRQDMADLMEVAARRGVTMSLEDAYNRAIQVHPDVAKVLAQRREAEAATAQTATMQRSRAAGVSVRTRPAGPATASAPQGRRAALEAAWDSVGR